MTTTIHPARWRAADGIELVGDVGGPEGAPTVVLMHGGGQTRHSWSAAMRALMADGYRVLNYDARGHGDSGWSANGLYNLGVRAADMAAVLAGNEGPVALVGASMGGATAMEAIRQGYRPQALVLVDIVPRPDPRGVERIRRFMQGNPEGFATLDDAAQAIADYNPHRQKPTDTEGLRKNLRQQADGRYHWHWDPRILAAGPARDLEDFLRTVEGLKRAPDLAVQLVRGALSDVVSDQGVAELVDALPRAEVFEVAKAGHMVAGDRNDVFNAGVLQFLRRSLPVASMRSSGERG